MPKNKPAPAATHSAASPSPADTLDTGFMLALRYKTPVITLEQAVADYLPYISIDLARRRASVQTLPFPVFRAENSQKSVWLVNIADIAAWLEKSRQNAAAEWQRMNS